MTRGYISGAAFLTCLLVSVVATAQEQAPTFTSDRPGFANSPAVAAQGYLTVETGLSVGFHDDATSGALPVVALRTGVLPWLELRAKAPDLVWGPDGAGSVGAGLGDPKLGFKVGGAVSDSVAASSVWEFGLPLGTAPYGGQNASFRVDLNVDWGIWGPLILTPNAFASSLPDATAPSGLQFEGGGSLKLTVVPLDGLYFFAQCVLLRSEASDWRVQLGGGAAYQFLPRAQIDLGFDAAIDGSLPPTISAGGTFVW